MPLTLGDLSFNVTGSTTSLQKSVDRIREFGRVVDQVAKSQQESAQATIKAYVAQERALKSALQQTLNMQQKLKAGGGTPEMLARTSNAFKGLTTSLTNGKAGTIEFSRAQDKFRLIMGQVNRDLTKFNALQPSSGKNGFATLLRDIQSSAVIAAGPLSGVASRIQAVSAMAERSSLSMAAFLGGVTAAAVGLGFLAKAAVVASMKAEQIQAVLQVGSGSATSAAHEFRYIHDEALKLGLSIDSLAMNYANLTAATQGTSLAGANTRKIFESVATASRALRMSQEATTGVFTALTQMVSKGVVYNEELTQQLSERIPGAFKIAADAMGVTTIQLKKMMSEGTLLSAEFLPKFADQLQKVFSGGAASGANSLDASLQNLSTRVFDFNMAFDKSLGISTAFKSIIDSTAGSIKFLTTHMDEIIGLVGALTGAMTALAVRSLLGLAIPAFISLGTVIISFTTAIRTAGISLAIFQAAATGGLSTLITLVATIGSAIAGYYAFKPASEDAAEASAKLSKEMADLVTQTQRNIQVMPELAETIRTRASTEIADLSAKIKELNTDMQNATFWTRVWNAVKTGVKGGLGMDTTTDTEKLRQYTELLKEKQAELANFNKAVDSVKPAVNLPTITDDKTARALDKAVEKIKEYRTQLQMLNSGRSDAEIQLSLAVQKMTEDLIDAGVAQGQINALTREYGDLLSQIDISKATKTANKELTALLEKTQRLSSGMAAEYITIAESVDKYSAALLDAGVAQEQINDLTTQYSNALIKYNQVSHSTTAANKLLDDSFAEVNDGITEALRGTKSLSEAFNDMVDSILEDMTRMLVQESLTNPLSDMARGAIGLGSSGTGGGILNWVSGLAGFAGGGSVSKNVPIVVGEKGKEVFVPPSNGRIVPNDQLSSGSPIITGAGSGGNNITLQSVIHLSAGNLSSDKSSDSSKEYEKLAGVLDKQLRATMMDFVTEQSRYGGVFYSMGG